MNHTLLLRATAEGDRRAFELLHGEFKDRVYNTALGYLQNTLDAEEITQDVFVEIFRSAKKFKGASTVSTWIYRITVNKSLDKLKHAKRKKRFAGILGFGNGQAVEDEGREGRKGPKGRHEPNEPNEPYKPNELQELAHPGVLLEQKENATILFREMNQLPVQQKTALVLAMVECLPQNEVAEIMNISVKAVESLLQRAKSSLRVSLAGMYEGRRNVSRSSSKSVINNEIEPASD